MNRIIKKYPNRRLYDTAESRYITLADIRDLVIGAVDFIVIDKKSGDDITRSILLQVISEQEQQRDPIMSEAFLAHVIRAYGTGEPGFLARHLEKSLTSFIAQQNQLLDQVKQSVAGDVSPHIVPDHKIAG
jgi:polyhydroxyalkanoate synthesis repressor PhaR